MKYILLFIIVFAAQIAASQPSLADTSRIEVYDKAGRWSVALSALRTFLFPSQTGNSGKYLTTDGSSLSWATVSGGSGAIATDTIWATKGDIVAATGNNAAVRVAAGTDGMTIYYDADETAGIRRGPYTISPTQITSDQDNYNPSGFDECQVLRLDGDNGIRAITSLAATFDGDRKLVANIGSYPIYFPAEHPDGTAGNRISGRSDFILLPGDAREFWYDGTSSRWRVCGYNPIVLPQYKGISYWTSYGSNTSGDWGILTPVTGSSGTITATDAASGIPGHWLFSSTTSSTGTAYIYFPKGSTQASIFGDAHLSTEVSVSIPVLSDGTERFWVYLTLDDASTTTSTAGAANNNTLGIRYYHGNNSGKWELFSKNNGGTESTVDSGVTVSANVVYTLRCEIDKGRSEARYYINNAYVGRITSNLPNANTCSPRIWLQKTAGTTARTLRVHSFGFQSIYP